MKRRKFIQAGSMMSLPFFVGGTQFTAMGKNKLFDLIGDDNDKVLVLVQLQGGNDGLSMILPLDQYDNLQAVRSNVVVPNNSILKFSETNGFHPSMGSMIDMWDSAKLGIVQGVAYPNQNRSHFRSTDIWHSASEPDEFLTTGWMGRYFDLNHSDYPEAYPSDDCPDPFALTIGTIVSETCQGMQSNFSLALTNPFDPGSVNIGELDVAPDNCYGRELTFVREVARQTNEYSEVIKDKADKGNNLSNKYPEDNALAQKLRTVARLISGGMQTKIYVVQIGGFDLHSNQVVEGDTTAGRQAEILKQLSDAICAFQDDCVKLDIDKRVMGMTYSEFGRRIRSNLSNGTDHGTAAPLFVFGSCVNPQIIGDNPVIDTQVDIAEGVPMQYDFRSVYATLLMDWFNVSEEDVRSVLFKDFQHLPLIEGCASVSTIEVEDAASFALSVYPNPFDNYFNISFKSLGEHLRISLFNAMGAELQVVSSQHFSLGDHAFKLPTHNLSSGVYFVRVAGKENQKTVRVVKAH